MNLNWYNKIKATTHSEILFFQPDLIVFKEVGESDLQTHIKLFDKVEEFINSNPGRNFFYLIDLAEAKRPSAEARVFIHNRLEELAKNFKHVAVFTGSNAIMNLAIKFFFARVLFESASVHGTLKKALEKYDSTTNK